MNENNIRQEIDKIETNIEIPADDTNLTEQYNQKDNWGKFLNNKTFKNMKENFRLLKSSLSNFLTDTTNDLKLITDKQTNIESDLNIVQTSVNDLKEEVKNKLDKSEGSSTPASGGNATLSEEDLNKLAQIDKENNFKEVNTFEKGIKSKEYKIDETSIAKIEEETLNIGDVTKKINILGKDTKLLYNGQEIQGGSSFSSPTKDSGSDGYYTLAEFPVSQTKDNDGIPYLEFSGQSLYDFYEKPYTFRTAYDFKKQLLDNYFLNKVNNPVKQFISPNPSENGDTYVQVNLDGSKNFSKRTDEEYQEITVATNAIVKYVKEVLGVDDISQIVNFKTFAGIKFNIDVMFLPYDSLLDTRPNYSQVQIKNTEVTFLVDGDYRSIARLSLDKIWREDYTYRTGSHISSLDDRLSDRDQFKIKLNLINKDFDMIASYYNNPEQKIRVDISISDFRIIKLVNFNNGGGGTGGYSSLSDKIGMSFVSWGELSNVSFSTSTNFDGNFLQNNELTIDAVTGDDDNGTNPIYDSKPPYERARYVTNTALRTSYFCFGDNDVFKQLLNTKIINIPVNLLSKLKFDYSFSISARQRVSNVEENGGSPIKIMNPIIIKKGQAILDIHTNEFTSFKDMIGKEDVFVPKKTGNIYPNKNWIYLDKIYTGVTDTLNMYDNDALLYVKIVNLGAYGIIKGWEPGSSSQPEDKKTYFMMKIYRFKDLISRLGLVNDFTDGFQIEFSIDNFQVGVKV